MSVPPGNKLVLKETSPFRKRSKEMREKWWESGSVRPVYLYDSGVESTLSG